MQAKPLAISFYQNTNVLQVATALLGKILITNISGNITGSRIVETEAYNGIVDKASHSYNNRRTKRTEVMYQAGGIAYVYLCYGMHYMFNVVTGVENNPTAVLIRATEPLHGFDHMYARTKKQPNQKSITNGPGNVCKAMGINKNHNGISLLSNEIYIVDDGCQYNDNEIKATPRIGIDYAEEDALLPYRFIIANSQYIKEYKIN
jgi:DNA-3-methyladenine glycosylase